MPIVERPAAGVANMRSAFSSVCAFRMRILIVGCVLNAVTQQNSVAAQSQEPAAKSFRDRVCDVAILRDGARLTGIALSDSPVRLVVRTLRLKADASELFTNEVSPLLATQLNSPGNHVISRLRLSIEKLKIDAPDDLQQIGLLEEVVERLHSNAEDLPEFVVVEIEPKRLRKLETPAPNRRALATLALLNQIDDFENLHWKTVAARLQSIPAEQRKRPTPATPVTSPDVVAERILAAVDVRLNKATRLIRTGTAFVAEDAKPDLATLLSSLAGDSLQKTLQELLNETGGAAAKSPAAIHANEGTLPAAAIQIAEKSGHATAVVSSFEFDLAHGAASVTRQLFRTSKPGGWKLVSSVTGASTTRDVTQEQVQKIEDDPQIKQISGLLSQLSPDGNSLKTALQMGAVVQSASSKADTAFQSAMQDLITARTVGEETPPTVVLKAPTP